MTSTTATAPAAAGEPPIPPDVARRAVEWLVELRAEQVPPATLDGWRRWRAEHPDHERAWRRIEAVDGRLHPLATPVRSAIARATLAPPGSARRRQAVLGVAALLFAGGAAWMARDDERWSAWVADARTAPGERRRLVLDDGTAVELNSGSALDVVYGAAERRLRLLAGEVLIRTAPDAAERPFLVETAQGRAQALGTRFSVRQQPGTTLVAVFEGAVRVTPRDAAAQARVLKAGQQARFTREAMAAPQPADADGIAWAEGFIVAKGMRLADFLAELQRHDARALSCDPALADLRVSGSYPLADTGKVLDALSATLPLRVETTTRLWGLQTARVHLAPRRDAGNG
jgi:transmembrane sensor